MTPRREADVQTDHWTVFVPGHLVNPLNGTFSRAHWTKKSAWAADWKIKTRAALLVARPEVAAVLAPTHAAYLKRAKRIAFLAQTGSGWDDDNLPAGVKPIRDALIGLVIHSDAPDSGHVFSYSQVICRQHRGVAITVEAL